MKNQLKYGIIALAALLVVSLAVCGGLILPAQAAGTTYYVDCSAGTNGDGSQSSPWNNLDTVNATTFAPGDSILFKRGTTCTGQLWPKGSGTAGSPISMGAYGTGALPIISGGSSQGVIKLWNQEYWEISDLESAGGDIWGIYVSGDAADTFDYIRITNVVAHDVGGVVEDKETGLVVVNPSSADTFFNDVVIDGAVAYNTTQWMGILGGGDEYNRERTSPRSTNVIIRNSSVNNVYGDAICIFQVNHGLIETSVGWDTGNKPNTGIGTPNSIWTWMCGDCTVQYNEGYLADSPSHDGGVYDIDWGDSDNFIQYNYAHDSQGYCLSVFGSKGATTNSVVRYNVCSNNARDAGLVDRQGDIFVSTWAGGTLDGVQIYNNTVYWNPAANYGALKQTAAYTGSRPNFFKNNIIYSTVPTLIYTTNTDMELDYNIYWYTGAGDPVWVWNRKAKVGFSTYQAYSGQDAHGMYADPMLNDPTYHGVGMPTTSFTLQAGSPAIDAGADVCVGITGCTMGTQDFFGNAIPSNGLYDIGAHEYGGAPPDPTDTPEPPTDTPVPPTDTPEPPPTDTPEPPPTDTPGGPTDTPAPPTDTPVPPTDTPVPPTDTPVPPTDTPAPTATPGGSTVMHVEDIYTTDEYGTPKDVFNRGETIYWQVLILDQSSAPVEGADVRCSVERSDGVEWFNQTQTTGADGWAYFDKTTKQNTTTDTYTIYVENVTKTGATYDPNANVKDSHQFVLQ
jgi:hypothetical protein